MEEVTMTSIQMLTSYGALGAICLWFMWRDSIVMKKLSDTLSDFTIMFKVFIETFDNGGKKG